MSDLPVQNAAPATPPVVLREHSSLRTSVPFVVAGLGALTVALLPLPGIDPWGQRVLAIILVALVLWISEALPVAVTSILVVALLALFGAGSSDEATRTALHGFQLPAAYFLLATLVIGVATVKSGLATRLASILAAGAQGSARRVYLQFLLFTPPGAVLIPSALTRNAILIPAYEQVYERFSLRRGDRLPRLMALSMATLQATASTAVLTGGTAPITAAFVLGGFGWIEWFIYMAVPNYALLLLVGLLLLLWHRPAMGKSHQPDVPSIPKTELQENWVRPEIRAGLIIGGMTTLWILDFWTGWNPLIPALLGAVALMAPGIGVLTWRDFEATSPWSIFFVTGSALSIAFALQSSGAATWVAESLLRLVPLHGLPVLAAVGAMLLFTLPLSIALPDRSSALALLIPLLGSMAVAININPIAIGLMVAIVVQSCVFYPVQSPTAFLAYQTHHFAPFDLLRTGLILFVMSLFVVFVIAIPWWNFVGLHLQPSSP